MGQSTWTACRDGHVEKISSKPAGTGGKSGKKDKKKSKGWESDDSEGDGDTVQGPQLTDIMHIMEQQQR